MNSIISETIKETSPELKPQSIKQFVSCISSVYKSGGGDTDDFQINWFNNHSRVDDVIENKTKSLHSRRNCYVAIARLFKPPNNKYYLDKVNDLNKIIMANTAKNTKTELQQQHWKSFDEVREVVDNYRRLTKPFLMSKTKLDWNMLGQLSDFIMLCVVSGYYVAPRRSADYVNMRIRGDIDKQKDNFIEGNKFVFNNYKTSGSYGRQEVEIPKPLKLILDKYIKKNPTDYLLVSARGQPISQVNMTQKLNKIFGDKISTSMLRHIYLTHMYQGVDIGKMRDIAQDMGHSVSTALNYVVN